MKLLELQAMPNPFSDELTVAFDLLEDSKTRLILTDFTGRFLFFEKEQNLESGRQIWTWNTEDLPEGAYLVGLKTDGAAWVYRKVILVRR